MVNQPFFEATVLRKSASLFFFLLLFSLSNAQLFSTVKQLQGRVVKIIDGDTYDVLIPNRSTIRIRMYGIDAPERGMAFYASSKNYLAQLCMGKVLRVQQMEKDIHGRIVAKAFLSDGRDINLEMIKAGMAWHFKKYDKSKSYAQAELHARKLKKGLWADKNPIAPWDERSRRRKGGK
jgi:endonuclease YncB( thermonuclease family)